MQILFIEDTPQIYKYNILDCQEVKKILDGKIILATEKNGKEHYINSKNIIRIDGCPPPPDSYLLSANDRRYNEEIIR